MKTKSVLILLLVLLNNAVKSQELDTQKLDALFHSLEKRDEAMGCITISKKGRVVYEKAFGYQYIAHDTLVAAAINTHYRIWSITKMYTATMIFQLIEEQKLSLSTTLNTFYPEIPNAAHITVAHMLGHKSGIPDFVNNLPDSLLSSKGLTPEIMANKLIELEPDFMPNSQFQYSNSNYLLLGYIIEKLDGNPYELSLHRRISNRIGLSHTHFKNEGLMKLRNKAHSYQFNDGWEEIEEGMFSGPIPAGAGGIVSTTKDMCTFIEALFNGKLLSKKSVDTMIQGEEFYRLGIMQTQFVDSEGFGHTGGYLASESSLFYYPKDSLTIAYCTNGIVLRKEEIIDHVLKISHNLPFGISINRKLQAVIILSISLLVLGGMYFSGDSFGGKSFLYLGYIIAFLFWAGVFISGYLIGNYNHFRNSITELDAFYSSSGQFMSSIQFIIAILSVFFLYELYKACLRARINSLPLLPIVFIFLAMAGTSLFPYPNKLNTIVINLIIVASLSPILALILWKRKQINELYLLAGLSLLPIFSSLGLLISRPIIPVFVGDYIGFIQRLLYLGLTFWLTALSFYFSKPSKE